MTSLTDWIGRTAEVSDLLDPWRAQALHATLDSATTVPAEGADLPPGWHWTYFLDATPSRDLGPDGHPRRGGFMPPVRLPRRMWAGSRLEFLAPLALGERARKTSRIVGIEEKSGRSGRLCFVVIEHEFHGRNGLAFRESQDIVYRDPPTGEAVTPAAAPTDATWRWTRAFDAPRLFRYSALTFNSHRIHYDRDYARHEEGYPGLVVHGPLLATLMLELLRCELPTRRVRRFEFRAIAPSFENDEIVVCGRSVDAADAEVWIADGSDRLRMRGRASFE